MADENVAQDNTNATEETTETTETTVDTTAKTAENDKATETETTDTKTDTAEAPQIDASAFVLPEGFSGLDQAAVEEFMPIAKELGLTQDQAQKMVTLHANAVKSMAEKITGQQTEAFNAGVAEIKTAYGPKYEENMGKVQHLLTQYGGDAVLPHAQSMYGNKAMVDTLLKIAEAAGPARFVSGGTSQTKRDADILFGEK